MINISK